MKRNRYYDIECTCIQCGRGFLASRKDAKFCPDNGGKCKAAYNREEKKVSSKIDAIIELLTDIEKFPKRYGFLLGKDAVGLDMIAEKAKRIKDNATHQKSLPIMYIPKSAQTENKPS